MVLTASAFPALSQDRYLSVVDLSLGFGPSRSGWTVWDPNRRVVRACDSRADVSAWQRHVHRSGVNIRYARRPLHRSLSRVGLSRADRSCPYRAQQCAGGRAARLPGLLIQSGTCSGPPVRSSKTPCTTVVCGIKCLRANPPDHELAPTAAVSGGPRNQGLHVRERHLSGRGIRAGRVPIPWWQCLGVGGSGRRQRPG